MAKGLKQVWKNRKHILEGLKNNIFKQEHIEKIAEERFKICVTCPDLDSRGSKCLVPGTGPCCGICGCSLGLKLRDLSSGCGNEDHPRWEPILTEEEHEEMKIKLNIKD